MFAAIQWNTTVKKQQDKGSNYTDENTAILVSLHSTGRRKYLATKPEKMSVVSYCQIAIDLKPTDLRPSPGVSHCYCHDASPFSPLTLTFLQKQDFYAAKNENLHTISSNMANTSVSDFREVI